MMLKNTIKSTIHGKHLHKKTTCRLIIATIFFTLSFSFPTLLIAKDTINPSINTNQDQPAIRVVMAAAFVSDAGIKVYDDIFHYLGKKLQRNVDFVSGFSYSTINSMLDSGMVDIGFICGLPYVMKHDIPEPTVDLLLAPVMQHSRYTDMPIYYSYLIAHKNSTYKDFSALKGRSFVFNDEISNSGYNMPRAYLISLGETSGFFGDVIRSGSHEESIRMVALGKADVSAVDSLVYDYDMAKNSTYVKQTRILKVLGPAGIPPIVVSTKTPLALRNKIRDILLHMNHDPAGKIILENALVERFTLVDDSNYDSIRKMIKQAQDSAYLVIH